MKEHTIFSDCFNKDGYPVVSVKQTPKTAPKWELKVSNGHNINLLMDEAFLSYWNGHTGVIVRNEKHSFFISSDWIEIHGSDGDKVVTVKQFISYLDSIQAAILQAEKKANGICCSECDKKLGMEDFLAMKATDESVFCIKHRKP